MAERLLVVGVRSLATAGGRRVRFASGWLSQGEVLRHGVQLGEPVWATAKDTGETVRALLVELSWSADHPGEIQARVDLGATRKAAR